MPTLRRPLTPLVLALLSCLPTLTGCLYSQDRHSYISTQFVPKTISLVDQETEEVLWSMDVPINHELSIDLHRKDTTVHRSDTRYRSAAPANEFSYWLYDINEPGTVPDRHSGKLVKHETLDITGYPVIAMQLRAEDESSIPTNSRVGVGRDGFTQGPVGTADTQPEVTPKPDINDSMSPTQDDAEMAPPIDNDAVQATEEAPMQDPGDAEESRPATIIIDEAFEDDDSAAPPVMEEAPTVVEPVESVEPVEQPEDELLPIMK